MFSHFVPGDMGERMGEGTEGEGRPLAFFKCLCGEVTPFGFVFRILCSIISASRFVFRWLFTYFVVQLLLLGPRVVYVVLLCLEMFLIGG